MSQHACTSSAVFAVHVLIAVTRGDFLFAWFAAREATKWRAVEAVEAFDAESSR